MAGAARSLQAESLSVELVEAAVEDSEDVLPLVDVVLQQEFGNVFLSSLQD